MLHALLKTIHVLGVVVWIGGMAFSQFSLRPALAVLDGPARVRLMQQVFQRFFGRSRFDQPLVQPGEDRLIAQELGWLVVDQQDVDLVVRGHRASPLLAMQPHAQRR